MARTLLALSLVLAAPALAAEPVSGTDNECVGAGGQGAVCDSSADCELHAYATVCVEHRPGDRDSRRCEIPCESGDPAAAEVDHAACSLGETCVEAKAIPGRRTYYCLPSTFRMDLNLLDLCLVHHLSGHEPVFSDNACSLEANLTRLLDQNGDREFDIFDFDLCVLSFLEQPRCDLDADTCAADDLVACRDDADCGRGLYCDPDRHACARDCGVVAPREESFDGLERQCAGALRVCDASRGRCERVDVTKATCEADSQCPAGAYCLLGRCAPLCYRSVDCPGTDWHCTANNRCRALPHPDADEAFELDPQDYAIRFARDSLNLDAVRTSDATPLVIMNLVSKRQVVGEPSVSFGYRLELTYGIKQDTRCLRPCVDCAVGAARRPGETEDACRARQDDCFVDDSEEWIRLISPFGTVSAAGRSTIRIELDEAIAQRLSAGTYTATLRAIFDNGDSDTIRVQMVKASPSGEYSGELVIYKDHVDNRLNGPRPFQFALRLQLTEQRTRWQDLLDAHNLDEGSDIVDVTEGQIVYGELHGSSALLFTHGRAESARDDEVPFVGLYSPDSGRIRLLGVIDVPRHFCISESGSCAGAAPTDLRVTNVFDRDLRRRIEFIGPFDDSAGRWHGLYREKISGLAFEDLTLEGSFLLSQTLPDSSELELEAPLLDAPGGVAYPDHDQLVDDVEELIELHCLREADPEAADDPTSVFWARRQFGGAAQFSAYLDQAQRSGDGQPDNPLGRTTVFPGLVQFSGIVGQALGALGADAVGQQQHLNIYDFVSSRVLPCDPEDPSPPPACIDEDAVLCGLALHEKAILRGWVSTEEVEGDADDPVTGEQDLFCVDTISTEGCPDRPSDARALFALQEHNRFWLDAAQILKFDADRARSDAFLVMFRNEFNPFAQGAALSYKEDRLRHAVGRYDQLLELVVGRAASEVLFAWPARAFKQLGHDWLKLMQTIAADRMGAVAELVDLKRRIFLAAGEEDFVFAHHMLQQEYLIQVYLMALQQRWQEELFDYRGGAASVLEEGRRVLVRLDPARNALGVTPGMVFFENSDPLHTNWVNYRNTLVGEDGGGGLLAEARGQVADAIGNLQGALRDLDTLEGSLLDSHVELNERIHEICGAQPEEGAAEGDEFCQYLASEYGDVEDWTALRSCAFEPGHPGECPAAVQYTCPDYSNHLAGGENNCEQAAKTFIHETDLVHGDGHGEPQMLLCYLDQKDVWVDVHGVRRPCVGGEMGAELTELAVVDLQRRVVLNRLRNLLERMAATIAWGEEAADLRAEFQSLLIDLDVTDAALVLGAGVTDAISEGVEEVADTADCMIIGGLAVGTDCPGHIGSVLAKAALITGFKSASAVFDAVREGLDTLRDAGEQQLELDEHAAEVALELQLLEREVDELIEEYAVLTQTTLSISAVIDDLYADAQRAVDRYDRKVGFAADHLVGRESGYVLLGDHRVAEASETFQEILQVIYRMTMAFNHHYNVAPGEATNLVARALALVTLDDVAGFVGELEDRARDYCGAESIDCDWSTNIKVLRYSVRDQLFPHLRDIVDARTGAVVTAGEQFHDTITHPPYLRRRIRGVLPSDQIELPLSVPVTLRESTGGEPRWLIDPLECNQLLDARDPSHPAVEWATGNMALNVRGDNLGEGERVLHYELVRGGVDFVRSCHAEPIIEEVGMLPVLDYPIRRHMVGYAPQSREGQRKDVPAFVARSAALPACMNHEEAGGDLVDAPCWRYFARDRSLAAPDWKLVIPLYVDGGAMQSAWITGEGLDRDERPVIEDLVLYMRYRSRPIREE